MFLSMLKNCLSLSMNIGAKDVQKAWGSDGGTAFGGGSVQRRTFTLTWEMRERFWKIHNSYAATMAHGAIEAHFNATPIACLMVNADGNTEHADMRPEFREVINAYWETFKIDCMHHIMVEGFIVFVPVLTHTGFVVPKMLPPETYDVHIVYNELCEDRQYYITRRGDSFNHDVVKDGTWIHEPSYQRMDHVRLDYGMSIPQDPQEPDPLARVIVPHPKYRPRKEGDGFVLNSIVASYIPNCGDYERYKQLHLAYLEACQNPHMFAQTEPISETQLTDLYKDRWVDSEETNASDAVLARNLEKMGACRDYQARILKDIMKENAKLLDGNGELPEGMLTDQFASKFFGDIMGPVMRENNITPLLPGMTVTPVPVINPGIDILALIAHLEELISNTYEVSVALFKQNSSTKQGNTELLSGQKVATINKWCAIISDTMSLVYGLLNGTENYARQMLDIYEIFMRPLVRIVLNQEIEKIAQEEDEGEELFDMGNDQELPPLPNSSVPMGKGTGSHELYVDPISAMPIPVQYPMEFGSGSRNHAADPPRRKHPGMLESQVRLISKRPKQQKRRMFDITNEALPSSLLNEMREHEILRLMKKAKKLRAAEMHALVKYTKARDKRPDLGYGEFWDGAEDWDERDRDLEEDSSYHNEGYTRKQLMKRLAGSSKSPYQGERTDKIPRRVMRDFIEEEMEDGSLLQLTPAQQLLEFNQVAIATELKQFVHLAPQHSKWARGMLGQVMDDAKRFLKIKLNVRRAVNLTRTPEETKTACMEQMISDDEYIDYIRVYHGQDPDTLSSTAREEAKQQLAEERKLYRKLSSKRMEMEIDMLSHPQKYAEMGVKPSAPTASSSGSSGSSSSSSGSSSSSSSKSS